MVAGPSVGGRGHQKREGGTRWGHGAVPLPHRAPGLWGHHQRGLGAPERAAPARPPFSHPTAPGQGDKGQGTWGPPPHLGARSRPLGAEHPPPAPSTPGAAPRRAAPFCAWPCPGVTGKGRGGGTQRGGACQNLGPSPPFSAGRARRQGPLCSAARRLRTRPPHKGSGAAPRPR